MPAAPHELGVAECALSLSPSSSICTMRCSISRLFISGIEPDTFRFASLHMSFNADLGPANHEFPVLALYVCKYVRAYTLQERSKFLRDTPVLGHEGQSKILNGIRIDTQGFGSLTQSAIPRNLHFANMFSISENDVFILNLHLGKILLDLHTNMRWDLWIAVFMLTSKLQQT